MNPPTKRWYLWPLLFWCTTSFAFADGNQILNDDSLGAYHGWIRYLMYRHQSAVASGGKDCEEAAQWAAKLSQWENRISANPDVLKTLSGAFEWAYESEVDDSGQPFKIAIPSDYDPETKFGISLYMHGYSGNHMEHATGMESRPGVFHVSVLGRARGGYYQNLSEVDVLDVLKYVQEQWNIDPRRIHIHGGSMGGWASFNLTNRHPGLAASARITCGYGLNLPVGNWKQTPFYLIHSQDDYVVPIVLSRIPIRALGEIGGTVIFDETNGYGHESWNYEEGYTRADAWYPHHLAPRAREVTDIDFTAMDGKARTAYWASIAEWGAQHAPARFQLSMIGDNELYATLDNIQCLEIQLEKSPINRSAPLTISVNGGLPSKIETPIPKRIYLVNQEGAYFVETEKPTVPEFRLRVPGGARNLYSGEPLLIVWGTQGSDQENRQIANAALGLRRNAHPVWTQNGSGKTGVDGVIHEHNTYGLLRGKADFEVTDEDIRQCHLVIMGTVRQNSLAARLAEQLPIKILNHQVKSSDGISWDVPEPVTFLLHYNPLAKDRLIFWIASENSDFYETGETMINRVTPIDHCWGGKDFVLFDYADSQMVATRNFDSRWNWRSEYRDSPMVPKGFESFEGVAQMEACMMIGITGADLALVKWEDHGDLLSIAADQTRMADLEADYYEQQLVVLDLSSAELERLQIACREGSDPLLGCALKDQSETLSAIQPHRIYRVVTTLSVFRIIMSSIETVPENMHYSGQSMHDAYKLYLSRAFDS